MAYLLILPGISEAAEENLIIYLLQMLRLPGTLIFHLDQRIRHDKNRAERRLRFKMSADLNRSYLPHLKGH